MVTVGFIQSLSRLFRTAICLSSLLQIHAFSTLSSPLRHIILHAAQINPDQVFQDDDCLDLCDAYGNTIDSTPKEEVRRTNTNYKSSRRLRPPPWSDPQPTVCEACDGEGDLICRFCFETGFLSAIGSDSGAKAFYAGMGHDCPVCKDGMEICHDCAGTGYVFSWDVNKNV